MENAAEWRAVKRLPQTKPLLHMKLCIAVKTIFEKLTPTFEELCDPKGISADFAFCCMWQFFPELSFIKSEVLGEVNQAQKYLNQLESSLMMVQ